MQCPRSLTGAGISIPNANPDPDSYTHANAAKDRNKESDRLQQKIQKPVVNKDNRNCRNTEDSYSGDSSPYGTVVPSVAVFEVNFAACDANEISNMLRSHTGCDGVDDVAQSH